ncbi:MAG: hypothetical protein A2145_01680 [candidate division Zixibacteria bacterium RBG_16_40_9]|nr:MAG: hypothetical protein A2145_01680 [candidate division Zixibacteria bacterium RBG_16_40_9]
MSPQSYFIGIDLGASQIKYGIVSSEGKVLTRGGRLTPQKSGRRGIINTLVEIAENLFKFARKDRIKIRAIGVGSPGCIDIKSGKVLGSCPNLPFWVGTNLKQIFRRFSLPVASDNDANLMALAEAKRGVAKNSHNIICLTIGSGIGGGIILNGEIFRGSGFAAGEIGHTTVGFSKEKCRCGAFDCLETYASVNSMLKMSQRLIKTNQGSLLRNLIRKNGNRLDLEIFFQAFRKKDKIAQKIVDHTCQILSSGIANVVNILNPEMVVIGGGLVEVDSHIIKKIEKQVKQKAFATATKNLKIEKAQLGNQAGFIGAAYLASQLTSRYEE